MPSARVTPALTRKRGPAHDQYHRACPARGGEHADRGDEERPAKPTSARRRQRVIAALDQALDDGAETTVTGIARAGRRGPGLPSTGTATCSARSTLSKLPCPPPAATAGPAVTCASLQADLLAAHERSVRLARPRPAARKNALSEALGEQAWREIRAWRAR